MHKVASNCYKLMDLDTESCIDYAMYMLYVFPKFASWENLCQIMCLTFFARLCNTWSQRTRQTWLTVVLVNKGFPQEVFDLWGSRGLAADSSRLIVKLHCWNWQNFTTETNVLSLSDDLYEAKWCLFSVNSTLKISYPQKKFRFKLTFFRIDISFRIDIFDSEW